MPTKIEIMMELDKRGKLPEDKKILLSEAKRRGLITSTTDTTPQEPSLGKKIYQGVISPTVEGLGLIGGGILGAPAGPIGAVGGAALVYTAARSLTKAGDVLLGYSKPETPIESLTRGGKDILTGAVSEMTGQIGGAVLNKAIPVISKAKNKIAHKLYESAIKPVPSLKSSVREKAIATGLENAEKSGIGLKGQAPFVKYTPAAYRPTEAHVQRVSANVFKILEKSDNIVRTAAKHGDDIPTSKLVNAIDDLAKEYKSGPFYKAELQKLDSLKQELIKNHGNRIPVDKALIMKKHIYETAKSAYESAKKMGYTGIDPIKVNTEKAIARAIRIELEDMYPATATLNKEVGKQIEFGKVLEQAAHRVGNREMFSLFDFLGATTGGAVGGVPGAAVGGLLAKVATGAQVKSFIAKEIYKARIPWVVKKELLTQVTKLSTAKHLEDNK